MKIHRIQALVVSVLLTAPAVLAQDTTTFVVATYYRCNQATETRADAIFKEVIAPLLQKEVAAGRFTAYGWATHWMGDEWRRLEYVTGTDLNAMVDARDAMINTLQSQHAKASEEFNTLCPSHDDYIWSSAATSQSPQAVGRDRAPVAMSTYFRCDSRETEADAIVKTAFAPVMNQHVKEGKVASWNWLTHLVGGEFRRILVLDFADHKSAVQYWSALTPALNAAQPDLSRRFGEICFSHSDYIWDVTRN